MKVTTNMTAEKKTGGWKITIVHGSNTLEGWATKWASVPQRVKEMIATIPDPDPPTPKAPKETGNAS